MRTLAVIPFVLLSACSDDGDGGRANAVDVSAAANRAEGDIANYAALKPPSRPTPTPQPTTTPSPDASVAAFAPGDQGSEAAAAGVVRRYVTLIGAGRYREAQALWSDGGKRSGMSAAAFAASFAGYASFTAAIGTPADGDAGAGQRYVTVPVHVTGTLRQGGPFVLDGPVVLHRVADGIDTPDPADHLWRIDRSALAPRPIEAQ